MLVYIEACRQAAAAAAAAAADVQEVGWALRQWTQLLFGRAAHLPYLALLLAGPSGSLEKRMTRLTICSPWHSSVNKPNWWHIDTY